MKMINTSWLYDTMSVADEIAASAAAIAYNKDR